MSAAENEAFGLVLLWDKDILINELNYWNTALKLSLCPCIASILWGNLSILYRPIIVTFGGSLDVDRIR